jgi:long-subunit acyl-CoA synthetase (AMP-forming)
MKPSFDLLLDNPLIRSDEPPLTIGELLFNKLPHRKENSKIILSHFGNSYTEIDLRRFRYMVKKLLVSFDQKGIKKGQTVIMLTFNGCNEMITAIFFIALATKGCISFIPMYSESGEFSGWIDKTNAEHIIIPGNEVFSLQGHEREKSDVREIEKLASIKGLAIWDTLLDFGLNEMLTEPVPSRDYEDFPFINENERVLPDDDILIVTTSGSSGNSRLVVYTHKAYFYNCLSWEQAGFFRKEILGGVGFTPLLTHTMGIRALMNAIWTGSPICLIITEWFIYKPETVRYLLLRIMPDHITGGPAVYNIFLELFRIFPETKTSLGHNFKTLVSSGAAYNHDTAREVLNATGLRLHNAFGTTETQQVFSTLLSHSSVFKKDMIPLGKPLPGVTVGLSRTDPESNYFRLYVRSLFGHKYCIGEENETDDGFFDTGDIIWLDDRKNVFYVRRAILDYFKDGFGVKIPAVAIKKYYKSLIDAVLHCEFFPVMNFPGLAVILFIDDNSLPPGAVTEARTLKKYSAYITEINDRLASTIEPFEYQHRHICRLAIVNDSPPLTGKGTISVKQININYKSLIERLTDTRKETTEIESTDSQNTDISKYSKYLSPQIGGFLSALKMNYQYESGIKDSLFTYIGGKLTEVLDVAGGYGTNLLGHNNNEVADAVKAFLSEGRIAISNQLSIQNYASLLAEKLNFLIGGRTGRSYRVVFGSTGSEAVEIAIHHAYFEWERRIDNIRDQQYFRCVDQELRKTR